MNVNGSDRKTVKTLASGEHNMSCPGWSNDDKKISYTLQGGEPSGYQKVYNQVMLRTINANGGGETTVAALTPLKNDASYNPGNKDTARTSSGPGIAGRVWSPGNTSILLVKSVNNVQNLYYINIATKKMTQVTSNTSANTKITYYGWSSDGYIVYTDGIHDAYIGASVTTVKSIKPDVKTAPKTLLQLTGDNYVNSLTF